MSQDNTPITTASDSAAQPAASNENTFTSMWSSVSQWVGDMAANVQLPQAPRVQLPGFPSLEVPGLPRIGVPIPGFGTPGPSDVPLPPIKIPGMTSNNPLPGFKLPDISIVASDADDEDDEDDADADEGNRLPAPGQTVDGIVDDDEYERARREDEDDEGLFDDTLSPQEREEVQRLREQDRQRILGN